MRYLYLMHAKTTAGRDAYKVGISDDPKRRRGQLCGAALGITLLAAWRFDWHAAVIEKEWHRHFDVRRSAERIGGCGEWFALHPEEVKTFVTLNTLAETVFDWRRRDAEAVAGRRQPPADGIIEWVKGFTRAALEGVP